MSNYENVTIPISIPSDDEGFVLLKCPTCGEKFMLKVEDIEDESLINIWCPNCGLPHDNYFDDDVYELTTKKAQNFAADLMNNLLDEMKKSTRSCKNIKYKRGEEVKKIDEYPIGRKVVNYSKKEYLCCNRVAKISDIKMFEGGYCPFSGEMIDGDY